MSDHLSQQKMVWWRFAHEYNAYAKHKMAGHENFLAHVYANKPEERSAFESAYSHAKANPELQKIFDTLDKQQTEYYSHPHLESANPAASKTPPWETSMKALENIESGLAGLIFQKIGEYFNPNNPEKAAALGGIGKSVGNLGSNAAKMMRDKQAGKEFGKQIVPDLFKLGEPNDSKASDQKGKGLDSVLKEIESLGKSFDLSKPLPSQKVEPVKSDSVNKVYSDSKDLPSNDSFDTH